MSEGGELLDALPLSRQRRHARGDSRRERFERAHRARVSLERVDESIRIVAEHRDPGEPTDELGGQLRIAKHRDRRADLSPTAPSRDEPRRGRSAPAACLRGRLANRLWHRSDERRGIDRISEHAEAYRARYTSRMKLDHVRSAIAFGAHPDDVEVGAGGLVAKLAAQGAHVTIVVGSIPNRFAVRKAEAIAAARHLGATLALPPEEHETRLEDAAMHALVARFERELAAATPDLAIVHGNSDVHWDHMLIHRAAMSALRRSRCDILAYATLLPAGSAPPAPTCVVDISSVIEQKLAAIREHASQFPEGFAEARRQIAHTHGLHHGVQYAELYEVVRIAL